MYLASAFQVLGLIGTVRPILAEKDSVFAMKYKHLFL
jgi:hypothetical protein